MKALETSKPTDRNDEEIQLNEDGDPAIPVHDTLTNVFLQILRHDPYGNY